MRIQEFRAKMVNNPGDRDSGMILKGLIEEEERSQVLEAVRSRRFSRLHWAKEGDLPSKFFFSFLKNRGARAKIRVLEDGSGEEIEDEGRIQREFSDFYSKLYQSEDRGRAAKEFLDSVLVNKLSSEEREWLEREVDPQEIERVVKNLAKGKSPGLDGFPNEFYQRCWEYIREDLGGGSPGYFH